MGSTHNGAYKYNANGVTPFSPGLNAQRTTLGGCDREIIYANGVTSGYLIDVTPSV
jgi:hypothetical protein